MSDPFFNAIMSNGKWQRHLAVGLAFFAAGIMLGVYLGGP